MGKEKKETNNNKKKNKKEDIIKSPILKILSILMIVVGVLEIVVVGLYIVLYIRDFDTGAYKIIEMINNTLVFLVIAVLEILMGIYGKKGADGDKVSLKNSRVFAILSVAVSILYVGLSIVTKNATLRLVTQVLFPLAFYFITFMPNFKSYLEKEAAKVKKENKEEKVEKK